VGLPPFHLKYPRRFEESLEVSHFQTKGKEVGSEFNYRKEIVAYLRFIRKGTQTGILAAELGEVFSRGRPCRKNCGLGIEGVLA
jgi:hypothetical protein